MAVFGSLGRVKSKALDLLGVKPSDVAAEHVISNGSGGRRLSIGSSSSTTDVSMVDGTGMLSGPSSPTYISPKAMDILGMDASSSVEDLLALQEDPSMDVGTVEASHAQEILETVLNLAATGDFDIEYTLEEYPCRYCDKVLGGLEHLRRHLHAQHKRNSHLSCPEGCNNKIWTNEGMNWHMKIMHDKPEEEEEEVLEQLVVDQGAEEGPSELLNDSDVFIVGEDMAEDVVTAYPPDLSLLLRGMEQPTEGAGAFMDGSQTMPSLDILERLKQSSGDIRSVDELREELEQALFDHNHVLKIAPNRAEFRGLIADLIGQNNSILRTLNGLEQTVEQDGCSGAYTAGFDNGMELPAELQHLALLSEQFDQISQDAEIQEDGFGGDVKSDAIQRKFKRASMSAYDKLVRSAPSQSPAFQDFVASIGDHSALLQRGIHCLSLFLSHEMSSLSLLDVYSFLHVAYAISRTETDSPSKATPVEFRCGIDTFRSILDDFKFSEDCPSEQELFDEIVDVMWNELEYAVAWIGKQKNWNWDFMTDTSSKARRLQVARHMLKAGAANDSDSILNFDPSDSKNDLDDDAAEPSFVREVREWGERYGQDIVEINVQQFRNMQNGRRPRDKSKWWNIVTSSIFFIVLGFLQAIRNTNEIFDDYPDAPYSCLLNPDPESDKSLMPQYRDYMAQMRINVFAPTLKHFVVDTLPDAHLTRLVSVGLGLVKSGVIVTVRDFENYILGLRKLFQSNTAQDTLFVANVLSNCWTCSSALEETMSYKIKQSRQPEYGPEYIAARIDEEYEASNTFQITTSEQYQDETMHDAEHETISEHSPAANSSAPSTPVSRVFSTPSPRSSVTDRSTVSPSYSKVDSPPQQPRRRSSTKRSSPQQQQPLVCSEEGCSRTFSSQSNLNRHRVSYHGGKGGFLCGVDGCDVRFTRKDNVYKHRDVVHGVRRKPKRKQQRV